MAAHLVAFAFVAAALTTTIAGDAAADDDKGAGPQPGPAETEQIDGPTGCAELDTRNERETRVWNATRPAVPYQYERQERMLGYPWPEMGRAAGRSAALLIATFVPHLNAALRDAAPEPGLSWPLGFAFGPRMSCSRQAHTLDVHAFRPLRVLFEPGLLFGDKVTFFLRPGARFVYHPSQWVAGVGGGLGSTIELAGVEAKTRASVSPEALLQLGTCCEAGYVTLAVRRELFFAGKSQLWFATVGFTYF